MLGKSTSDLEKRTDDEPDSHTCLCRNVLELSHSLSIHPETS